MKGAIGGGMLKMLAMTAVFYGRYTWIVFVFGVVFLTIAGATIAKIKNAEIKIAGVPFVLLGSLVASAFIYY